MKTPFVTGLPEFISQYRQDVFAQMQCDRCGKAVFYNAAMDFNREIASFAERHLKCKRSKRAMKLGYARISTADQSMNLQLDALKTAGVERVFTDTASGAESQRPGLADLMERTRPGDIVVVWRLDRLARSLKDLIELSARFETGGVHLHSLTEGIDTTTAAGKLFFHIFGSIAEFERNLIVERTQAGLAAARARGRTGGRKPALDADKKTAVNTMLDAAKRKKVEPNFAEIGRAVGVSERTIRRFATGQYAG